MRSRDQRAQPWLATAIAAVFASAVLFTACVAGEEIPPIERRAQEINKVIMCPVCPGESIDQSQHPLAVQMRAIVAEQLGQGWTEGQIKAYLVESYNARVLLEPPREGSSLIVWLVPPVGLALAGVLLFATFRMMLRPSIDGGDAGGDPVDLSEQERAKYFRRVEAALGSDVSEGAGEFSVGRSDSEQGGSA